MQEAIMFFIIDSVKIIALLFLMIAVVGTLRTWLPASKVKKGLAKLPKGVSNFAASCFGALTPFCSCSSIPLFMSMLRAGVPVGTSLSFLITSPIVNEYLVVLMLAFFGVKITALYVLSGLLIGTVAGIVLSMFKVERYLEQDFKLPAKEEKYADFKSRLKAGLDEAVDITKKLWLWILAGVGIGAIIHNTVPQAFIQNTVTKLGFFGVPVAVLLGVPMYGSCAAIVPIAVVLFEKGMPLGTALAFMMAISALSLPEAIILKRVMKPKLIIAFYATVTVAIILTGYLFNLL